MTLEDLALFGAVAERRSITEAARTMAISQPTASRRLQALEEELGQRLINRDEHPVTLTAFGYIFLDFTDNVLQSYQTLHQTLSQDHSLIGTLAIATSSSPAARIVTRYIAEFLKVHPMVQIALEQMNSHAVEQAVLDQEAMLGFMGTPPNDPSLQAIPIDHDEIVLLVPHRPPFLGLPRPASWEALYLLPFVVRSDGSGTQQLVRAALLERAWPPIRHAVLEVDSGQALVDAVESGLGAGFVSRELLFRRSLRMSSPWPLQDFSLQRSLFLIFRPEIINRKEAAREFVYRSLGIPPVPTDP